MVVPEERPLTRPDKEPIVAIPVGDELQIPPPALSVKMVVPPRQTCVVPEITKGPEFTVTVLVATHPVGAA